MPTALVALFFPSKTFVPVAVGAVSVSDVEVLFAGESPSRPPV